jgi:hypothetical protein
MQLARRQTSCISLVSACLIPTLPVDYTHHQHPFRQLRTRALLRNRICVTSSAHGFECVHTALPSVPRWHCRTCAFSAAITDSKGATTNWHGPRSCTSSDPQARPDAAKQCMYASWRLMRASAHAKAVSVWRVASSSTTCHERGSLRVKACRTWASPPELATLHHACAVTRRIVYTTSSTMLSPLADDQCTRARCVPRRHCARANVCCHAHSALPPHPDACAHARCSRHYCLAYHFGAL